MKTGRNDPCPCGSGKKFKKCCLGTGKSAAPSAPAKLPTLPQPSASADRPPQPVRPPAPPPRPRDPVRERREECWKEFKSQAGDRIAVYLKTAEEKELMVDDMAFEMLNHLHQDAVKRNERARFAELVAVLADRQPDVYEQGAHNYLSWQLHDALAENRTDILPLVRDLAARAGRDIDIVNRDLLALAYHGRLDALVEAFRIGWPSVRSSDKVVPWGVSEFADKASSYEMYNYVEQTSPPDGSDPALLDRVQSFIPDPRLSHVQEFIADLTGEGSQAWTVNDFVLQPPSKRNRDDWDDDDEEREDAPDPAAVNLGRLIAQFVGYLRRVEGIPYPKGELIRHELFRYFIKRHVGELNPRLSMMEQALHPKKKLPRPPKPSHPLCPEHVTFEVYLADFLGFMSFRYHTATALFELVPAWLRFLEARGLIDRAQHTKTLEELRPLHTSLLSAVKTYTDDPALYRNLQGWPGGAGGTHAYTPSGLV